METILFHELIRALALPTHGQVYDHTAVLFGVDNDHPINQFCPVQNTAC